MHMTFRLVTLAFCTLAAFGQSFASGGNAHGEDSGTVFCRPAALGHASRPAPRKNYFEQQDAPEPAAVQNVAIEDSDENPTYRSRAHETRSPHDLLEDRSISHRPPSAHTCHADLMSSGPLIYRLCKLLI